MPTGTTYAGALGSLRDQVVAQATAPRPSPVPAWRMPWTRGRLFVATIATPILYVAVMLLPTSVHLVRPLWVMLAVGLAGLGALVVATYLPSWIFGYGFRLGTTHTAAAAIFYVLLAGYVIDSQPVTWKTGLFSVGVLALALVTRVRGTYPQRHAR